MTRRRSTTWAAALATGLLATVAGTVPAEAAAARATAGCETVQVSSHRGEPTPRITENTVQAFQRAVAGGARSVESDLRLTSDGVWILMHDGTVNRTTNGTGRVAQMTLAQIRALRTDGGQRVPTFDEAVSALPAETGYQMEFKTERFSDRQLMAVVNRLRAQTKASDLFFTSRHRVLQRLHAGARLPARPDHVKKERLAPPACRPTWTPSTCRTVATAPYIARVHASASRCSPAAPTRSPSGPAGRCRHRPDRHRRHRATPTGATPEHRPQPGRRTRDFGV